MVRRLLTVLVLVLACGWAAAAEAANPLDQAEVVLRVRDGRWVDREATRFAAAYGADLAGIRGELARALFRSRSFDGIDLARPALLAWRPGRAPLIAAIPITNRAAFLDSFGAVESDEAPLVRVGEREGSVVYTQSRPEGLWEYRLLVANNTAFLARSIDECCRLAAAIPPTGADPAAAPLEIALRGDALLAPRLPGRDWLAALPPLPVDAGEMAAVPGLLAGAWKDLASQLAWMSVTARSGGQGELQLNLRLAARPDSLLAGWIAQQRPGTERLAGQLRTPATGLLVTGRLVFQGQLERWAFSQVDSLKTAAGARWTDAADTAFRGLCTLAERSGAWGLEVQRSGGGLLQRWVVEHPRPVEVAQSAGDVAAALGGRRADAIRLGDHPAFSLEGKNGSSLFVAGDRHAVRVDDLGGHSGSAAAGDLLKRLEEPASLDAAPSLASLWIDLGKAWNVPPAEGDEPAAVTGLLRPLGSGQLELACSVPVQRMAVLLARLKKPGQKDE